MEGHLLCILIITTIIKAVGVFCILILKCLLFIIPPCLLWYIRPSLLLAVKGNYFFHLLPKQNMERDFIYSVIWIIKLTMVHTESNAHIGTVEGFQNTLRLFCMITINLWCYAFLSQILIWNLCSKILQKMGITENYMQMISFSFKVICYFY